MKKELTTRLYKDVFDIDEVHTNVNKFIKAVIVNFENSRYINKNDEVCYFKDLKG